MVAPLMSRSRNSPLYLTFLQDLYVVIELRDWIWRTPFQNNSGANAIWENLEGVVTDINGDILKLDRLKISVWDKNTLDDVLLGRGSVSLRKPGANLGRDVTMNVPIKDKFSQPCGIVEIVMQVQDSTLPSQFSGTADVGPSRKGHFEVNEIHLTNLKNTGKSFVGLIE